MAQVTQVSRLPEVPDEAIDQLLHPAQFYARPADAAADELLTIGERRAILSSWASDACAVDSQPALRRPPLADAPVTFDEIMDALAELDRRARVSKPREAPRVHGRATITATTALQEHRE
jgi:hypothetical protein